MYQRRSYLLLALTIALFLLPVAAAAAGGGDTYITVSGDTKEYKNLRIGVVDALDPLETSTSNVTLRSTETGDLRSIEYPLFGEITRTFNPASGTYHGVQVTVTGAKTIAGSTLPCNYQVYTKPTLPSFTVKVPPGRCGNVLLVKAPENLPDNGSFDDIFRAAAKEGYFFAEDGLCWTLEDGRVQGKFGTIVVDENNLTRTLLENKFDLSCFEFNADSYLERGAPKPSAGEYLIAAVQYDGATDTMHVLAAMPVTILNGNQAVTWNGDNPYYQSQNRDVSVSFTGADRVTYALIKEGPRYGLSMTVNTSKLAEEPIPVSTADLVEILKTIAGEATPVTYALTVDDVPTNVDPHSGFAIAEGYGCSGYANASSVTITTATLRTLNPGTYSLYAMALNNNKVIAIDQTSITIAATAPTPAPTGGGGGGGGPSGPTEPSGPVAYEGTGSLTTDSTGIVTQSIAVSAVDGVATVVVPAGVQALDANGNPITEIGVEPLASDAVPAAPAGAVFTFAGYAYEASPAGATFDPAIALTMQIPEDVWNNLDLTSEQPVVKWYNEETGLWEDVPTTFDAATRTVRATVTHFSIFALFTEPVPETTTPTETPTTTTTTTAPGGETPTEGLPMTVILSIFAVVVIIVAAGYFLMMRK
ncbi:hypothetical protein [Methanoculleus sp.]|uniref:hypothetical protein n=1 Tax=Methanoculleus sp. TaxID=90427 RepID=UPI0025D49B47|nr:hypothetical protein [Methanoculleus sp.]